MFGSLLKTAAVLCFLSSLGKCVFQSPKMNEAIQSCPAFESAGWQLLAAAPEDVAQMIVVAETELLPQQTDKAMAFYWFSGEKGRILLCRYFKAKKGFEGLENCGSSSGQFERAAGWFPAVHVSWFVVDCVCWRDSWGCNGCSPRGWVRQLWKCRLAVRSPLAKSSGI